MTIEPADYERLVQAVAFALKHLVPTGTLVGIVAQRHERRPGAGEDLDAQAAAEIVITHLEKAGWQISRQSGSGLRSSGNAAGARPRA